MADTNYLIAGLGNPGSRYEDTRHNIGFRIVDAFAQERNMVFKADTRIRGELAKDTCETGKLFVLKPATYMNLSGEAVRSCVDYYKIPLENILIVTDDVYIPFGSLRLRAKGSCGGHNGLENIEKQLNTNHYSRLRVGVGNPADSDMASFVLQRFKMEEKKELEKTISRAVEAIELWLRNGIINAMNQVNVHPKVKEKKNEEI